jgi:hypothetical protein
MNSRIARCGLVYMYGSIEPDRWEVVPLEGRAQVASTKHKESYTVDFRVGALQGTV